MTDAIFPQEFPIRLSKIIPQSHFEKTMQFFEIQDSFSIRLNPLKADLTEVEREFKNAGVSTRVCPWYSQARIVDSPDEKTRQLLDEGTRLGKFYRQSLSSMLAVVALDPQPEEMILDLCAAPGSKTSQIAAHMNNTGKIIAIESVRDRFYKLKSVLELLGVQNVQVKLMDGRRYHPQGILFDRILVDASCSSEGRFKIFLPKSFAYWSTRKIKEMAHKQKGLLLNACRYLKPGGVLVYSTCTFAPEENEAVIDWVLKKAPQMRLEPIQMQSVQSYPAVLEWEGKQFDSRVKDCFRVLPTDEMEGFFIAKLVNP